MHHGTLLEICQRIAEFNAEQTIYALKPWSPASLAVVIVPPEDGAMVLSTAFGQCRYFLEVDIARGILEGNYGSPEAACRRVIQYAECDA